MISSLYNKVMKKIKTSHISVIYCINTRTRDRKDKHKAVTWSFVPFGIKYEKTNILSSNLIFIDSAVTMKVG